MFHASRRPCVACGRRLMRKMAGGACGGTEPSMLVLHVVMTRRVEYAGGACDGSAETREVLDESRKLKGKLLVRALPRSGYPSEDGWWRLRRRRDQRTEAGVPLRRMPSKCMCSAPKLMCVIMQSKIVKVYRKLSLSAAETRNATQRHAAT